MENSASDTERGHVLSCSLPVHPSVKQSHLPDSNWADNAVCLIPMVTRSLPHQDAGSLWIWGDWDVHGLLAPITTPSEPTTIVLIWFWIIEYECKNTYLRMIVVSDTSNRQRERALNLFAVWIHIFQRHVNTLPVYFWTVLVSEEGSAFRASTPLF